MSVGGGVLFVGFDLAERHSAVVVVDYAGTVLYEDTLDTGAKEDPPNPFAKSLRLLEWWDRLYSFLIVRDEEPIFVIEDIAPHMMDPKPALKLQGALIGFMAKEGLTAHIITAQTWQRHYGYVSKKQNGDTKKWATALCESMDYEPGSMLPGVKILAKAKTDLRDAYLLAMWLRQLCIG